MAIVCNFNPREAFLASNPKLNRAAFIAAEETVLDGILAPRPVGTVIVPSVVYLRGVMQ